MSLGRTALGTLAVLAALTALAGADSPERRLARALAHYRSGVAALKASRIEQAERELRAAARLEPLLGSAHYALGRALMALQRHSEAVEALLAACDAYRRAAAQATSDRIRADSERQVQMRDEIDYFQLDHDIRYPAALVLDPRHYRNIEVRTESGGGRGGPVPAEVFLALGSAQLRLGAWADAERAYLEAVAVRPAFGEAHNNLAVVYLQAGRLEDAAHEIELAEQAGFSVSPSLKEDVAQRRRQP